jgi:hypothetical protein
MPACCAAGAVLCVCRAAPQYGDGSSSSNSGSTEEPSLLEASGQQQAQQQQQPESPVEYTASAAEPAPSSNAPGATTSASSPPVSSSEAPARPSSGGRGSVPASLSVQRYVALLQDARRASWPLVAKRIQAREWIELSQLLVQPPFDAVRQVRACTGGGGGARMAVCMAGRAPCPASHMT